MSATNTTTNYNLPIFIGSDKPAWLVDFNGAMNAIDAQMKVNADAIATKSPILTFNDTTEIDFTKSGNTITANLASGVSDKVGRALVTPIAAPAAEQLVGINTSGTQDYLNIGSGLYNDNGTLKAIDLNLTDTGETLATTTPGGLSQMSLLYAFNSDHSIGKIYGALYFSGATANTTYTLVFDSNAWVPAPETEYDIWPVAFANFNNTNRNYGFKVRTDGRIQMSISAPVNGNFSIAVLPVLYFFKNFGDTPQP